MKILLTIPHYYHAHSEQAQFRSLRPSAQDSRVRLLEEVLDRLHLYWGGKTFGAIHSQKRLVRQADDDCQIDVRIVTVKDRHLIERLRVPEDRYRHIEADIDPLTLGFHCHRVLQENAGLYDFYGYLEDDILIEDPFFFHKLQYLNQSADNTGMAKILFQPQRFESAMGLGVREKQLYNSIVMDYQTEPSHSDQVLAVDYLGRRIHFEATTLPHAGCFFLTNTQLGHLAGKENFGQLDRVWVTPLDTAATFAVGTNFKVYKPVLADFHFFAVRHGGEVISDKLDDGRLLIEAGQPVGWTNPGSGQ